MLVSKNSFGMKIVKKWMLTVASFVQNSTKLNILL